MLLCVLRLDAFLFFLLLGRISLDAYLFYLKPSPTCPIIGHVGLLSHISAISSWQVKGQKKERQIRFGGKKGGKKERGKERGSE